VVQIYAKHGCFDAFAKTWVKDKVLEKNHVGNEMVMLAMVLDRMIQNDPNFLRSEGCEIMARRVYALQRAYQEVHHLNDWKQPKGASASKWKSKVRWDVAGEIDWRSLTEGDTLLNGVEKDVSARLQQKANIAKWLAKSESSGANQNPEE
jgi:hypothetical protein